jgi:hypothetical protein
MSSSSLVEGDLPVRHCVSDRSHSVNGIVRGIERRDVDLNQPLLRQESIEQKLQHLHIAGLRELDALADELLFFASKKRLRYHRRSVLGPWRATPIALGKRPPSRKFRVFSRRGLFGHILFLEP